MNRPRLQTICRIAILLGAGFGSPRVQAGLTILSGPPSGSHVGNLVVNGSFEVAAPPNGGTNAIYWADPAATPYAVPPGWLSTGPTGNTALWGNDSGAPYRLKSSDVLPDGRVGVSFTTTRNTTVNQPPTFHPNGTVTFPAPPTFTSIGGGPVILRQVVNTNLTPAPSYYLSFWVSGEENATVQGNTGANIMGMRMTNVLPGDPIQYLAVPNGLLYGQSQVYQFQFTPLNPLLPVDIRFVNWGGLDLSPYGMSAFGTQPILDDVIVNALPEPASIGLLAVGGLVGLRRRTQGVPQA